MKSLRIALTCIFMLSCMEGQSQIAAATEKTRILFVLDASYSMVKNWGNISKWEVAKRVLGDMADTLQQFDQVEFGMRIFGHQSGTNDQNCKDSRLELPIGKNRPDELRKKLQSYHPNGITPIVYSLMQCSGDFGLTKGTRNILILITDGEESCGGDPCKVAQALRDAEVSLRPFVIGLDLPLDKFQTLMCVGEYVNAASPEDFSSVLTKILKESVSRTTFQVNLNDASGKPTETNVAMSFTEAGTNVPKYHLYHTLNGKGLPDTLEIDAFLQYNIKVHTLPPLVKQNFKPIRNAHNTIIFPASQGQMFVELKGVLSKVAELDKIKCLVRKAGDSALVNIQGVNTTEKYLSGKYDLEILTLPRTYVKALEISDHKTTSAKVPLPGLLTISKSFEAFGGVFYEDTKTGRMIKLHDLNGSTSQEMLVIQPGKYRIVYRSKHAKTIHTSVDKEFEMSSGGSLVLKL